MPRNSQTSELNFDQIKIVTDPYDSKLRPLHHTGRSPSALCQTEMWITQSITGKRSEEPLLVVTDGQMVSDRSDWEYRHYTVSWYAQAFVDKG